MIPVDKQTICRTICPDDFEEFWSGRAAAAAVQGAVELRPVAFANPAAKYDELSFPAADGVSLHARYIRPAGEGPVPTVLMYHDYGRGIRGWHHMTRFAALGYGVLALENRFSCLDVTAGYEAGPESLAAVRLFSDAVTLAHVALKLPGTDTGRLMTWGEGLGGGLAIAAAAFSPCAKCAVLNPLPADFRTVWRKGADEGIYAGIRAHFRSRDPEHQKEAELFRALDYIDAVNFAPYLRGNVLLGTAGMDTASPPETQLALFERIGCGKRYIEYPKYVHERINFFENELLKFMHG